jgi:hypothetical protein
MNDLTKCDQDGCSKKTAYRFTWPGRHEAGICEEHAVTVRAVAQALGVRLQLKPMPTFSEGTTSATAQGD